MMKYVNYDKHRLTDAQTNIGFLPEVVSGQMRELLNTKAEILMYIKKMYGIYSSL